MKLRSGFKYAAGAALGAYQNYKRKYKGSGGKTLSKRRKVTAQRRKYKYRVGSRTRTRKRKGKQSYSAGPEHGFRVGNAIMFSMKPTAKFRDLAIGRSMVEQTYSGCIGNNNFIGGCTANWTSGQQTVVNIAAMCSVNQIAVDADTGYDSFSTPKAFFNLNPNALTTGAVNAPYNSVHVPDHRQLVIKNSKVELELTNFATGDAELTLYVVKCRCNTETDPVETWIAGIDKERYNIAPAGVPASGAANTIGSATVYDYGRIPTKCRRFNTYWKVVGKRSYKLSAGQTQQVSIVCRHMQKFQRDAIFQLHTDGTRFLKGVTYCIFAVAAGQPCRDNTADITPFHKVTKASGLIGVVVNQKWNLNHLKDKQTSDNNYQGVGLANVALNKQTFIDVDDDPVVNQTAA